MSVLKDRRVWAWAAYDFANSAFATTVLAVMFNVYFVQRVVPPEGALIFGARVAGAALWGYTVSASMAIVFLLAPVLGAAADQTGRKKRFLSLFWLMGCAGSAGLFLVRPGDVGLGAGLFILGNVGFSGSLAFYNALLPALADGRTMGRISGLGWAMGYLGGGLCLLLNLFMVRKPAAFGLPAEDFLPVRAAFLSVGLWWLVFTLPLLAWVPEPASPGGAAPAWGALVRIGWSRLADTTRHLGRHRNLLKYLAAYLVYNDGIETVILMASIVGAQLLGMPQESLILCFLMIQGVAFVGALTFGELADRWGHRRTIGAALAVFAAAVVWGARMTTQGEFWALGVVVGLVLGGSQAASRSLMALLTPPDRSAEFFSFYGVVGKLTAVVGPLVFGAVSQAWGLRAGMLSLLGFFLLGGLLLTRVEEPA